MAAVGCIESLRTADRQNAKKMESIVTRAEPAISSCPGCYARLPEMDGAAHPYVGASAACWDVFSEVLSREYSDPQYMAVHRMTVDAYCAQHPGKPERRSIQSVNVHLIGLHLVLDRNADEAFARQVIGAVAKWSGDRLAWLDPPPNRGQCTVKDIVQARDASDHGVRVRDWASGVWAAWTPHHSTVVRLAKEAIGRM